jgi:hypothetical protein
MGNSSHHKCRESWWGESRLPCDLRADGAHVRHERALVVSNDFDVQLAGILLNTPDTGMGIGASSDGSRVALRSKRLKLPVPSMFGISARRVLDLRLGCETGRAIDSGRIAGM